MIEQERIADMIERHDLDGLATVSETGLAVFLRAWLDAFEQDAATADYDRLLRLGVTLVNSGHEDADEAALRWVAESPSPLRLDIVANVLHTLWNRALRRSPVTADAARRFVDLRRGLVLDEMTEYDYLAALSRALTPDAPASVRAEVGALLRAARDHRFENERRGRLLRQIIDRVLAEAGE